ncbi:MAG: hypothetical protein AAF333_15375 [Planctomycetota bacterium]
MVREFANQLGVSVAGGTGPIFAPVGLGPVTEDLAQRTVSVALNGSDVWVVTYDASELPFSEGPAQLWKGNLGSPTFTPYADLVAQGEVVYVNDAPHVAYIDEEADQIVVESIAPDGVPTPVFSMPTPAPSTRSLAVGHDPVAGELLIATSSFSSFGSQNLSAVSTGTWEVARSVEVPGSGGFGVGFSEVVVSAADRRVNLLQDGFSFIQPAADVLSLPDLEVLEESPAGYLPVVFLSAPATSDAFDYDYDSALPAVVELEVRTDEPVPELLRATPVTRSAEVLLDNWATPDDTPVSGLAADTFFSDLPVGVTVQDSAASPGELSQRSLGTFEITVDPREMPKGTYRLTLTPALRADYDVSGLETRRNVEVSSQFTRGPDLYNFTVAVDPFEGNYIGNGTFDLGSAGWDLRGSNGARQNVVASGDREDVLRVTQSSGAVSLFIEQILDPGLPEGPARFSFDYLLELAEGRELQWLDVSVSGELDGRSVSQSLVHIEDAATTDGWLTVDALLEEGLPRGWSDVRLLISLQSAISSGEPTPLIAEFDNLVLEALVSPLAGDYNADGFVSQADLSLVLLNWGDTVLPPGFESGALEGGGPFDGQVSQNELSGVLLNWGNGSPSPVATVPEPALVWMLGFGALTVFPRWR